MIAQQDYKISNTIEHLFFKLLIVLQNDTFFLLEVDEWLWQICSI
jgi:hypothetical protein